MVTMEVFLASCCHASDGAKAVAEKAAAEVGGVRLIFRCNPSDRARAEAIGIVTYPAFVIEGVLRAVGTPSLRQLAGILKEQRRKEKNATQESGKRRLF